MKKVTSIKIEPTIWKKAKKHCIDNDLQISAYIERLIEADLKKSNTSYKGL